MRIENVYVKPLAYVIIIWLVPYRIVVINLLRTALIFQRERKTTAASDNIRDSLDFSFYLEL